MGSGGFSTVFAAMDTLLDREVAIKILKSSLHEDEELVTRFLLEAKLNIQTESSEYLNRP